MQVDTPVYGVEVEVECLGQPFLANAQINSAVDHVVLDDGREPIDMVFVAEGLVVFDEQAGTNALTKFLKRKQAQVAVSTRYSGFCQCRSGWMTNSVFDDNYRGRLTTTILAG